MLALARLVLGLRLGTGSPTSLTSGGQKSILKCGLQTALVVAVSLLSALSAVVTLVGEGNAGSQAVAYGN